MNIQLILAIFAIFLFLSVTYYCIHTISEDPAK